jgi:uncharacterized OB-fold protein
MTEHLPIVDGESAPFWESLAEQRLMLKWCTDCGRPHFYPRVFCPYCWSATEWRQAAGTGTVFATTTVRTIGLEPFHSRTPYNISIVELDEGPRMLTNVIDVDVDEVQIGLRVRLQAQLESGFWMPRFVPAGG